MSRQQQMPFVTPQADKLRGGYYTPVEVTRWLCDWAIRSPNDRVLEPSCGNGLFLESSATKLLRLGAHATAVARQLTGVELIPSEAALSLSRLRTVIGATAKTSVHSGDFFEWLESHAAFQAEAIVGNPPFIRYQNFPESSRSRAMRLMKRLGLSPNKLTNIWVPFVVGATECLAPSGRLAMVLPAELLQVSYARQLRSFLVDHFADIEIVACNHLFFEGAEQEVVLLRAEGRLKRPSTTNQCRINLWEAKTIRDVFAHNSRVPQSRSAKRVVHDGEKWLKYFLTSAEIEFMRALKQSNAIIPLRHHASVDVGVVTGKNEFFVLAGSDVDAFDLGQFVVPLVGRASQLKGAVIPADELNEFAAQGHRVFLLRFDKSVNGSLTRGAQRYIRFGEQRQMHTGYKCSTRNPWYAVPSAWSPNCFLFRQIYDFPRVVLNRSAATSTDTIHRMQCVANPERVSSNIYTHLTAASAEIEGRSYGGGVLELEPTEAEKLLVPRVLTAALPIGEVDRLIRLGKLDTVLVENDKRILRDGIGLSIRDCTMLKRIWSKMRDRRTARARNGR